MHPSTPPPQRTTPASIGQSSTPLSNAYLKVDDPSVEERLAGLESLSYMLDDGGDVQDGQKLGKQLRAEGGVKRLSQMLQDSSQEVVAYALWVLANLCCDAVDPGALA